MALSIQNRIQIKLSNGDTLVAEECPANQIAIGVVDENGSWIQDLCVVETTENNKYDIFLYEDEYDEGWTRKITIDRVPSNAL